MFPDLLRIQMFIHIFRRYVNIRLCHQYITIRCRSQRSQLLTDPFGQSRSSHDTIRNICTDIHTQLHQILQRTSQIKQAVHSLQGGCSIRTSSRHTGCDRNMLLQVDLHALGNMIFLYHKFCRFIDQVILIRGKLPGIRSDDDAAGCPLKIQYIINTNGLHDHLHFVIAIFQSSDNIQAQINFGICFYPIFVHFALLRFVYNDCT